MKTENRADLSKLTTVGIGGTADTLYIPESIEELRETISLSHCEKFIGGGV